LWKGGEIILNRKRRTEILIKGSSEIARKLCLEIEAKILMTKVNFENMGD